VAALVGRYALPPSATGALGALLDALAAEPDPPTTVADRARAVEVHLADSLSGLEVEALRAAPTIVDLGAGAGFPGLPLAVALPHARVDLVEARARKGEVIERLRAAADIGNARAVVARAEDWARAEGTRAYSAVTARALGSLALLCEYAAPLLEEGGVLVCWKGARDPEEEASGANAAAEVGLSLLEVRATTPFFGSRSRHLHVFAKTAPTPPRFPRRAGIAAKRPLGP
jgi:16S rRNA (guanine527-N7)-methyltransferase